MKEDEKLQVCKHFYKMDNETTEFRQELNKKFNDYVRDSGDKDTLLDSIFDKVICSKFSKRSIRLMFSPEEVKLCANKLKMDYDGLAFSIRGVGVIHHIYKQARYYENIYTIKEIWEVFKDRIKEVLKDKAEMFETFMNFVEKEINYDENHIEKLTKEETEKIKEMYALNKNSWAKKEPIKEQLYLIFKGGRVLVIQSKESEENIYELLERDRYLNTIVELGNENFKDIAFSMSMEKRIRTLYDNWTKKNDKLKQEKKDKIKQIKEQYKEDLMLLKLKESNKNG